MEINTGDHTWEWIYRVSGIYLLPAGVSLSANFNHESGVPEARQVLVRGGQTIPNIVLNAGPRGSLRLPHTKVMDFRVDKAFALSGAQRLSVRVNLFNALNSNAVTARTLRAGAAYLRPTRILPPRGLRNGAFRIASEPSPDGYRLTQSSSWERSGVGMLL